MKNPYRYPVILFTLLMLAITDAFSQKIENIKPSVVDDRIYINYDLTGIPVDQPVIIRVFLSTDGGKTYGEPLKSVSGDVGIVVGPGINRRIIWDVFEEMEELDSEDVKFRIQADILPSAGGGRSIEPGFAVNLNPELGGKVHRNSYGFSLKIAVYLKQLGLGVKGVYYRNFDAKNRGNYYWGFSGGAILDYDLLRNQKYSLYPYMIVGQTKLLYVEENQPDEHSAYSIFYSPGIGFNIKIAKFVYLGIEVEYDMAPRVELVNRGNNTVVNNLIWDGINAGIVLRFAKLKD